MKRIYLDLPRENWYNGIKELLFRLLGIRHYETKRLKKGTPLLQSEALLSIRQRTDIQGEIKTYTSLKESSGRTYYYTNTDRGILSPLYRREDYERRFLARTREGIYRVLSSSLKRDLSPWGVLLGVRPTKLVYSFFDRGFSKNEIRDLLLDLYLLNEEKAHLLLQIVSTMYSSLSTPIYSHGISVYIGIPFCPSRCHYCSFPSEPLKAKEDLLSFLQALKEEIQMVGRLLRRKDLTLYSIYIGGGTPSILPSGLLEDLLLYLRDSGISRPKYEFTLEAGRPETLTNEKLQLMYSLGVNRISINPQTIWNKTLEKIGRQHTYQMVEEVYYLSREIGFQNINMDLILGLPGEEVEEMMRSLERISSLQPDHITVHVLAKKRKSILRPYLYQDKALKKVITFGKSLLQSKGMRPYYLYRQKDMAADEENVGYAAPGKESFFNLAMMEERQTVIGLGGSAVTKIIHPVDKTMIRLQNPKLPIEYIRSIHHLLATKEDRLTNFLP